MASDVKWIKIVTDIFDDEKILMIETMPECDTVIVIWFKLLCLAGKQNNSGVFQMGQIPYTDEMFSAIFRRPLNTVRLALNTFERFGMVEIIQDTVTIPNWGKHQSLDAYEKKKERDRERIARKRAEQKAIAAMSPDVSPDKSPDVAFLEEDKEKEKESELDSKISCQQIVDLYHDICKSFPKLRSVSESRKKAIRARLNTYSLEDFKTVFQNAENSTFLKGKNGNNWSATFDWLMKDAFFLKVLEGNYADKGKKEKLPDWFKQKPSDMQKEAMKKLMEEDFSQEAEQLRRELQESFGGKR